MSQSNSGQRFFFMAGLALALPGLASAQGRPNSEAMSCAQAAGLVAASGAAVIGTGPNIYDRYVTSRAYCTKTEMTEPAWVGTADRRRCFIGYTCKDTSTDDANR